MKKEKTPLQEGKPVQVWIKVDGKTASAALEKTPFGLFLTIPTVDKPEKEFILDGAKYAVEEEEHPDEEAAQRLDEKIRELESKKKTALPLGARIKPDDKLELFKSLRNEIGKFTRLRVSPKG